MSEARRGRRRIFWTAAVVMSLVLLMTAAGVEAQKSTWRQATDVELEALLPARAPVEKEHIETELRTASGITDGKGRFVAGVVLITAGYSADGKYSHFLEVQAPLRVGGILLTPGEYVFGWQRNPDGEALSIRLHEAHSGKLLGLAAAHKIAGTTRVESFRIWAPADKSIFQIGRFGVPYELAEK